MANPSKFFSAALEAAARIHQKVGTGQQLKSMMRNYGAKSSELKYIGAEDAFKDEGKYNTSELLDYINKHQVMPEEVVKRGVNEDQDTDRITAIAEAMVRANSANKDEAREAAKVYKEMTGHAWHPDMYQLDRMTPEEVAGGVEGAHQDAEFDAAFAAAHEAYANPSIGDTKWSQYVTGEPSDQYTEHLVTLPNSPEAKGRMTAGPNAHYVDSDYQSPHWEEPNVLAHMRYDYDPDALRLEEIQSDWLQQAREKGFKFTPAETAEHTRKQQDASAEYLNLRDTLARKYGFSPSEYRVPGALSQDVVKNATPEEYDRYTKLSNNWTDLKNTTASQRLALPRAPLANVNDWTAMMLRRAMLEAAQQDKSALRWTSGAAQDRRYSPEPGRAKYYDELIPNIAKKIARPYGDAIVTPEYWGGENPKWNRETGAYTEPGQQEMWKLDLPPKLIDVLQKKGKVPFFRHGGRV